MKILYTSSDVHKAIKEVFNSKYSRRVAVVAYLGVNAESFLPSPKDIKIICCPEPGATSPASVRNLIKRGANIRFSDDLHTKVYWSKGGCVITSANISYRALGSANQKEAGILVSSTDFDIDHLIHEVNPYKITQTAMNKLEKQDRKLKLAVGTKANRKNKKYFIDWFESPYKEPWKIGWWSESDLETAKNAIEKSSTEYNVVEPVGVLNVSKNQVSNNEWLLCFEISGKSIKNIEWMYVDFVVPVESSDVDAYEEDYPFQAIQVHKLNQYPQPPFTIEEGFRKAFKKAIKEYGTSKIENAKKLALPEAVLKKVAEYTD